MRRAARMGSVGAGYAHGRVPLRRGRVGGHSHASTDVSPTSETDVSSEDDPSPEDDSLRSGSLRQLPCWPSRVVCSILWVLVHVCSLSRDVRMQPHV